VLSAELIDGLVSNNIAPKLITIDDQSNGWRCIVLPMAHQDDLIRDAVTASSMFFYVYFLGGKSPSMNPEQSYQRVIRGLRRRQNLLFQTKLERRGVVVALLVLWTTIMVNGFSDFRIVHKLLDDAWSVHRSEAVIEDNELDRFLGMQVEK
jgi:hypothetical protein